MTYEEARKNIQTGDQVIFWGKGFLSWFISKVTGGPSHIGVAVRVPEFDFVCVWESTTLSTIPDLFTRKPTKGVQLVPLSDRIKGYKGRVAIRHMHKPLTADQLRRGMAVREKLRGRPYEKKLWQLALAALDFGRFTTNRRDLSSVFCSEGSGEWWMATGMIPTEPPSNERTPADLTEARGWGAPVFIS